MKKLLSLLILSTLVLASMSMVSAATSVTQASRFAPDKSITLLNAWTSNAQGQYSFAYQKDRVRISSQGKVTSYTEVGPITTIVAPGIVISINKDTKLALVTLNQVAYNVPLNVIK